MTPRYPPVVTNERYLAIAVIAALAGCQPKFESKGSLAIDDGTELRPVSCTVMPGTGIELEDAQHARLRLTIPPVVIDAFREQRFTPDVRYEPAGKAPRSFDKCGTLVLRGEGYHGSGKRAVSGTLSAPCLAKGEVTFSGCF